MMDHGSMSEFVIDEIPFRVPYETRRYRLWRWLWKLMGHNGESPVPDSWCLKGIEVVYDMSEWDQDRVWCDDCLDFTIHKVMRCDGDLWLHCEICKKTMVE